MEQAVIVAAARTAVAAAKATRPSWSAGRPGKWVPSGASPPAANRRKVRFAASSRGGGRARGRHTR